MKRYVFTLLFWVAAVAVWADSYIISGVTVEKGTGNVIPMATVRLMKADSSFVTGASSGLDGTFKLDAKKAGKYILKFSYIGYHPFFRDVTLTKEAPEAKLGKLEFETNDIVMNAATVKARLAKVEMRKDTFVYNVAAYRVPEGATLEALIEKLPGAVVDDNGGITINGKTVSEILVDGKDFFKGDTKVAMKNMPVTMIDRVKAYDKQSDYTEQTGIDDGNERTVLDLEMKKKLKSALSSNIDLAYGTHDRYSANAFLNRFTDQTRLSAFGSMNNVSDRRYRGGGPGVRGGSSGLAANKNIGLDGFWNNGKKEREGGFFQIGGNVRLSHNDTDALSRSNSETFLNGSDNRSFSNSRNQNYGKSSSFSAEMNMRWNPDSLTSLRVRPSFSHSESDGRGYNQSATFNDDPYEVAETPLDSIFLNATAINVSPSIAAIAVNRNLRESLNNSSNNNARMSFTLNRRLSKKGRSVSLDGQVNYGKSKSERFSISDIFYFQRPTMPQDYSNQYTNSPSKNWGYNTRFSYSEPLAKNVFLQASYNFSYSYSDSDRSLYQMGDSLASWGYQYSDFHPIGTLPPEDSLSRSLDIFNSQYATYRDYIHTGNVGVRFVNEDFNLSAGVRLQPEHTTLDYTKNGKNLMVKRNVFNIAPDARMRWNIDKYTRLELRYRGSSSQPSMTDLLDVVDNSDPLHITLGNPDLKPIWNNNFNLHYNTYKMEHQTSFAGDVSFSQTSNSISDAVTYDAQTGVRTTRPENVNGNWNTRGDFMFNTSFGPDNMFFIGNDINASYVHTVGYMSTGNSDSQKNRMRTLGLGDRLRTSYRDDFIEIGINGSFDYRHSRSKLQAQSNIDSYTFAYGYSFQWDMTWNMSFSTDMAMNSRRGFKDSSMNTNELIWNAQISQSFLKQNAATLSLQFYDILHQQSNISRTINAITRSDTWTNGINSYIMLHFIYKLNLFGGMGGRISAGGGGSRRGEGGGRMGGGPR